MFERYQNAKRALLARLYKGMNERQLEAVFSVNGESACHSRRRKRKDYRSREPHRAYNPLGKYVLRRDCPGGDDRGFRRVARERRRRPGHHEGGDMRSPRVLPARVDPAVGYARDHLHEQGGEGDEGASRKGHRRRVDGEGGLGGNVPLDLRAHPETFRREYRRAEGFLDLRHGRPEEARHRVPEGARARRQDVPGPRNYERDFPREGYSSRPERVRGGGGERFQALEARRGLHDVISRVSRRRARSISTT